MKNPGEPGDAAATPLWVWISQDGGLLSLLVVVLSGFVVSYVVCRGFLARKAAVAV